MFFIKYIKTTGNICRVENCPNIEIHIWVIIITLRRHPHHRAIKNNRTVATNTGVLQLHLGASNEGSANGCKK